jgi:trehalose 6-phosphate phosphatase
MDTAAGYELHRIAEGGARVGVVTGRSVESLLEVAGEELAAIPGVVIEGMYGAEQWSSGVLQTLPTPDGMNALRDEVPAVVDATVSDAGVWIEDKRLSLVVHTRMGTEPSALQVALAGPLAEVAANHRMELHLGKEVLEFRIPGIDKATALERLVGGTCRALVYAGDDIGDVPAFTSVRRWRDRTALPGITIGVVPDAGSPIVGEADWEVHDTAELTALLRTLGR